MDPNKRHKPCPASPGVAGPPAPGPFSEPPPPQQQHSAGGAAAADAAAPQQRPRRIVLVWDIDETLIVFNSLLTGSWAAAHGVERNVFAQLGERWENAILNISDKHFFYTQIEEFDATCIAEVAPYDDGTPLVQYNFFADGFPPPHGAHSAAAHAAGTLPLPQPAQPAAAAAGGEGEGAPVQLQQPQPLQQQGSAGGEPPGTPAGSGGGSSISGSGGAAALSPDDLRKLAYRYRHISLLYRFGLQSLGTVALRREWQAAFEETDSITGHWLTHAADLLAACSQHLPQLLLDDAERRRRRQQAAAKQGQGGQQAGSAADVGGGGGSSRVEPQPAAAGGAAGPGSSPLIAAHADGSLLPGSSAAVTASAAAAGPSDSPVAGAPTLGWGSPPAAAAAAAGAIAGAGLGRSSSSGGAGSGSRGGSGSEGLLPEVVHVAVTSGQLVPTLAKLLLFHLGAHFTPDRVYSSRRCGKGHCFDLVQQRWGADARYVVIGDGAEEDAAAAERGWPYLRVLLTDVMAYPAAHVLRLRRDAGGGFGLTLPEMGLEHIAVAVEAGGAAGAETAGGSGGGGDAGGATGAAHEPAAAPPGPQ